MSNAIVFDRRDELAGGPGTHALVCGVGEYPHLTGGTGELTSFNMGYMSEIESAARTAKTIADWLVENKDALVAPLATVRLLAAPTDDDVPQPALREFLRAAYEWRRDAAEHPDSMTFFYIAGHGFSMQGDQIILLQDYGDGLGSILMNAISIPSILNGMADVARTQLYFIDASRQYLRGDAIALESSRPSAVFDAALDSIDNRAAITFLGAGEGKVAFAKMDGLTLFGRGVIECLQGRAGALTDSGEWTITTGALARALPEFVRESAQELGVEQDVTVSGVLRDMTIARIDAPPTVPVTIEMPDADVAKVIVRDRNLNDIWTKEKAAPTEQFKLDLTPGLYMIEYEKAGEILRKMHAVLSAGLLRM